MFTPQQYELIEHLIQLDTVHSVACPFKDEKLWRMLVEEQQGRTVATGLPPQTAFTLCGPDHGLGFNPEEWGGVVHFSYEGICCCDLTMAPDWFRFNTAQAISGGALRYGLGGIGRCHFLISHRDHGEMPCATRKQVGNWFVYESTAEYLRAYPLLSIRDWPDLKERAGTKS
ncbi:hypothetical protein [Chitinimonas naiadis]